LLDTNEGSGREEEEYRGPSIDKMGLKNRVGFDVEKIKPSSPVAAYHLHVARLQRTALLSLKYRHPPKVDRGVERGLANEMPKGFGN